MDEKFATLDVVMDEELYERISVCAKLCNLSVEEMIEQFISQEIDRFEKTHTIPPLS